MTQTEKQALLNYLSKLLDTHQKRAMNQKKQLNEDWIHHECDGYSKGATEFYVDIRNYIEQNF